MQAKKSRRIATFITLLTLMAIFIVTLALAGHQLPASAANETVEVWLTLGDESKKLNRETDLAFVAGSGSATQTIQVDESTLYQRIEGVGAALTDSSAWLISTTLTTPQRAALMSDLFTRNGDGIGLSYVRVPMGASDFALSSYTYDDMPSGQTDPNLDNFSIDHDLAYIVPVLQQALALNPEMGLMGSPWSAPAWMKDNDALNGGSLKPEYYPTFADYHVAFAQAYAAQGLPIDTLTPQNEPMHDSSAYPTMYMTATAQQTFVRDHLGPALADAGLDTKILILDHNWDLTNYALTILNDPAAKDYVEGTAFHCYAGDVENQSLVHSAHPDRGIWFTECSGGGWATDFGDNLSWNIRNLVIGNMRNWGKSYIYWNLALDENDGPQNGGCTNCRGVVTINQATGTITREVEYYALGHVSKFVDPGAYRADSTAFVEGEPENVAFMNPDGSLVLIVHSTEATTFDVAWNGQHFTYSLPAGGVVTFKWDSGNLPGPTVTPEPTATPSTPEPTPSPQPAGLLQGFEEEGSYYEEYQVEASLTTEVVHGGLSALKVMSTTNDPWHTVGAYLDPNPVNIQNLDKICLWIYDTLGDNTMALRLLDGAGGSQEFWSDNAPIGTNPRTVQNEWTQLCFNLSAYDLIDLTQVERVQMALYWAATYYFDDITGEGHLVAHGETFDTGTDHRFPVAAPGVLYNDANTTGHAPSVALDTGPAHGSLDLATDGSFVYTPTQGFTGPDSFDYIVSAGTLSDTAVVTLNVHAPISTVISLGGSGSYDFTPLCGSVDFTDTNGVDTLTVTLRYGYPSVNFNGLPLRYDIQANGSGFDAALTLCYTDNALLAAGIPVTQATDLAAYRHVAGGTWDLHAGTVNTTAHTLTVDSVSAFSEWSLGIAVNHPTAVELHTAPNRNAAPTLWMWAIPLITLLIGALITQHRRQHN